MTTALLPHVCASNRPAPSTPIQSPAGLPTIIYGYPCQWESIPGRQRRLTEALSAYANVVFLSSAKLNSRLDMRRPRIERISSSLVVIHDVFALRWGWIGRRCGRVASAVDGAWLRAALAAAGAGEHPVYWLSSFQPEMMAGMPMDRMIFDCIDPCFDPAQRATFDAAEFAVARRAKLVFCTAESLVERLKRVNSNCHLLPNGCTLDRAALTEPKPPIPESIRHRKGPFIGYMGTFDNRLDVDTLCAAAIGLPALTFVLVGRINPDQQARVASLRRLPNVVMPGQVSLAEGEAYTVHFDVGLIPFTAGEMCDAINPVKMWMYLAAGKPVVSTFLRECRRYAPQVRTSTTPDEFVAAILSAVSDRSADAFAARLELAEKNTWDQRARDAMSILRCNGLVPALSCPEAARAQ